MLSRKSHRFFTRNAMAMALVAAAALSPPPLARADLDIENPVNVTPPIPWGPYETVRIDNTAVKLNNNNLINGLAADRKNISQHISNNRQKCPCVGI